MIANRNYEQCPPLTWVGQVPVYLATVIAAVHALAIVICAFALAAGAQWFFDAFVFSTTQALDHLHLWQFVSYAFIAGSPDQYLWIALQLFFLAIFGRDVEQFIGRPSFALMYVALLLTPPILLSVMSFFGGSYVYAGSGSVHFAVFIAFAYLYPRAELLMGIEARWFAIALLVINSLMLVGGRAPAYYLAILWLDCAVAVLWMAKEGVGNFRLPSPAAFLKRKHSERQLRVVKKQEVKEEEVHESIDPILEKIASRGMSSLTRSERETLERARVALLEKERRS